MADKKQTEYVVLEQQLDATVGLTYFERGRTQAANDQQAISAVLGTAETPLEEAATFVAVPARSWRPKEVAPNRRFSFS